MFTLTGGSKLTMYADDILLYKPICSHEDYSGLQTDIDAIQDCISTSHLTLNPQKCKYLICSGKRSPNLPPTGLLLTGVALEQVESYHYLGVLVSSRLTWSDHITQTCTKTRKLVGMLCRQFIVGPTPIACSLSIAHAFDLTWSMPANSIWDPFTNKGLQPLETIQKFACKVCLKQWDLDYDSMLQLLNFIWQLVSIAWPTNLITDVLRTTEETYVQLGARELTSQIYSMWTVHA